MPHLALTALIALLALAPAAMAQDQPPIDAIVASRVESGEPDQKVWDVALADLQRDHPAVARAVQNPDFIQEVSDQEEASTQAFFDHMSRQGFTAVRIAGQAYTGGITLGQSNLPPASTGGETSDNDGKGAPAAGALVAFVAVGAAAMARRKA